MTTVEHEPAGSEAARARPRLVFFYGATDGRSRRTEGHIDQVLQRRGNHKTFEVVRVDVDSRPDLAKRFRIGSIPTILVIDDNRVAERIARPGGPRAITECLLPWLH